MYEPSASEDELERLERAVRALAGLAVVLAFLLVAGAFLGLQSSVLASLRTVGPDAYIIASALLLGVVVVLEWKKLGHTNRFALIAFTTFAVLAVGWLLRSV